MPSILLYSLIFTSICLLEPVSARDVLFVQILSRHGDRAPTGHPFPKDVHGEEEWPRGWAELTSIGMKQTYELGQYMRNRYSTLLNDSYIPSQMYMRSSDTDRALTSAQTILNGLYPARGDQQWQNGNIWQPIPVHAATSGEDDLLCKATKLQCPVAEKLTKEKNDQDAVIYNEKYKDLFSALANYTGIEDFAYDDVNKVYDLNREITHNMSQPSWVTAPWPQYDGRTALDICTELRTVKMMTDYSNPDTSKFYAGYMLNTWINTALSVANGTQTNPSKLIWYSSHDTVQLVFMSTMGVSNNIMPPYATALFMEIFKENGETLVELFYRNDTSVAPYSLPIPGCPSPCPVIRLPELYKNVTLTSYDQARKNCGVAVESKCREQSNGALTGYGIGILITALLSFVL